MFEQKLFSAARIFTLVGISLLSIAFCAGAIHVISVLNPDVHVSPAEVVSSFEQTTATITQLGSNDPVFAGLTISNRTVQYFQGSNKDVLREWLHDMEISQRQEFLDNLEDIIKYAEQNPIDKVRAINTYHAMKAATLQHAQKQNNTALTSIMGLAALVIVTVLLTLVLVMLAIERNTRETQHVNRVGLP